jgi:hypothetical protein
LVTTPWGALLLFAVSYVAVSWQVGDTTRWRTPDLPVLGVIALAGWRHSSPRLRVRVMLLAFLGGGALLAIYYLIQEL